MNNKLNNKIIINFITKNKIIINIEDLIITCKIILYVTLMIVNFLAAISEKLNIKGKFKQNDKMKMILNIKKEKILKDLDKKEKEKDQKMNKQKNKKNNL